MVMMMCEVELAQGFGSVLELHQPDPLEAL